jgi:hypothetical protein
MNILFKLVSTNAGWLARQAVKYSAMGAAVITAWLIGHGLDATHASVIAVGATAIVLGGIEAGLSFIARKYAVPELDAVSVAIGAAKKAPIVIACLLLPACATDVQGGKTFLGIDSAGWLNVGKSAAVAAVPVALDERAKRSAKNPVKVQP